MKQNLISSPSSDPSSEDTREFWRETGKTMIRNSTDTLNEVAKQIVNLTGVLQGLYFSGIVFSDLKNTIKGTPATAIFLVPMLFLLVSMGSAFFVFFPKTHHANLNSSEAVKHIYEKNTSSKLLAVKISAAFLILSFISVFVAVVAYLLL